jgi:hypothetical protein
MSALSAFATGLPFVFFPVKIASILSQDSEIVKYCAEYIHVLGYVMFFVGWEMASFGALLGAGKASFLCWVNGSLNLARVPIAVLCMYGYENFWVVLKWVLGFSNGIDHINPSGDFSCIVYSVASTAVFKAVFFMCSFAYRYGSGLYFTDCNLVEKTAKASVISTPQEFIPSSGNYFPVNMLDESQRGIEICPANLFSSTQEVQSRKDSSSDISEQI